MNTQVKTAIQNALDQLDTKYGYIFANLNEANLGVDSNKDWPVALQVVNETWTDNKNPQNGLITSTFPLDILFLDFKEAPTKDFSTEELEPLMDILQEDASAFIGKLEKESIITRSQVIGQVNYTRIYQQFDAHLFGWRVRANVPVTINRSCEGKVAV